MPAWSIEPPRDPAAIDMLVATFRANKCEMKPVLRALLTSDFFKNARYKHLKSPAEVVVRHAASDGRLRAAEAWLWRAVDAAFLHGPGSAQSALG
ncbi:MAG: DUF1800 domain-containing protein [Rhodospirillales bacterium]|nr:DUF1800 domain-containing protein [Rhodospirillales bacterium]